MLDTPMGGYDGLRDEVNKIHRAKIFIKFLG